MNQDLNDMVMARIRLLTSLYISEKQVSCIKTNPDICAVIEKMFCFCLLKQGVNITANVLDEYIRVRTILIGDYDD